MTFLADWIRRRRDLEVGGHPQKQEPIYGWRTTSLRARVVALNLLRYSNQLFTYGTSYYIQVNLFWFEFYLLSLVYLQAPQILIKYSMR